MSKVKFLLLYLCCSACSEALSLSFSLSIFLLSPPCPPSLLSEIVLLSSPSPVASVVLLSWSVFAVSGWAVLLSWSFFAVSEWEEVVAPPSRQDAVVRGRRSSALMAAGTSGPPAPGHT